MRDETYWRARISRPDSPAVPIYVAGMRRTFWVPPRYRALALATIDGRRFRLRDLAPALGYSMTGLYDAIRRMADWGMLRVTTKRGRFGWTRLTWAGDVLNREGPPRPSVNVRPTSTGRTIQRETPLAEDRTFDPAAWRALGETLRALALPSRP